MTATQLALTGLELKEQGIASLERQAPQFGDSRLPERFWRKVVVADNGCWEWVRNKNKAGYGRIWMSGGPVLAHRLSYETLVGHFPPGLEPDHLCRTPACVNPSHMEPVTHQENSMRGIATAVNRALVLAKTACFNGHEYTEQSVSRSPKGFRICKPCNVLTTRRYRQRVLQGFKPSPHRSHCKRGHPFNEANTRITTNGRRCRICTNAASQKSQSKRPEAHARMIKARRLA